MHSTGLQKRGLNLQFGKGVIQTLNLNETKEADIYIYIIFKIGQINALKSEMKRKWAITSSLTAALRCQSTLIATSEKILSMIF